jgi:predicted nucleotidyltransferase
MMKFGLEDKLEEIRALCLSHAVEAFYLFGSAAKGEMKETSDYDFMVRFSSDVQLLEYADNYFSLLRKLEELLERKVDLVSEKSVKNPVLIKEIMDTRIPLYEAA